MSAYRSAIDHIIRVIEIRARYFRNQVVTVVLLAGCAVVWAVVAHSVRPLSALLLLVPVCGGFLFADSRALYAWQSELFAIWARRELDFFALAATMRVVPGLPKETLDGMLGTLPVSGSLPAEQTVGAPTRQAVAITALTLSGMRCDSLAFKTCAAAIITVSAVLGVTVPALLAIGAGRLMLTGLSGLTALCLLAVAWVCAGRWRVRRRDALLGAARMNDGFNPTDYAQLVGVLDVADGQRLIAGLR